MKTILTLDFLHSKDNDEAVLRWLLVIFSAASAFYGVAFWMLWHGKADRVKMHSGRMA